MDETDNTGNKPVTQITRDQMAQNDHDELVRYGVMLKTIVEGQLRLEQQIKDLITGQSQALATWEIQSKAVHDSQDIRIRKLEDIGTLWVPKGVEYETWRDTTIKRLESLEDDKNKFLGGWKTLLFIGGVAMGVLGLIVSIVDTIVHISH